MACDRQRARPASAGRPRRRAGAPSRGRPFMYDETRKYMMRATSPEVVDAVTGAVQRQAGWIEKSTYY